jgi:hypothetical protein
MAEFESWNTQIVEFEGPSDPNPGPAPEASIRRWEALRELYRQVGQVPGNDNGGGNLASDAERK